MRIIFGLFVALAVADLVYSAARIPFHGPTVQALYFYLPAALVLVFLGFATLKGRKAARAATLTITTALCLWGADAFLERTLHLGTGSSSIFIGRQPTATEAEELAAGWKDLEKSQVVARLRESGADAVSATWGHHRIEFRDLASTDSGAVLPLAGVSRKLTVFSNENERWSVYASDEHGFNNPLGLWREGEIAVAGVGDSFTQGAAAQAGHAYMDHLRQRFPQTLNIGMAGNGPLCELAELREYLAPLKPKTVLWFYYNNDLNDLAFVEKNVPLLMRYLEEGFSQGLLSQQGSIDKHLLKWMQLKLTERLALRKDGLFTSPLLSAAFRVGTCTNLRSLLVRVLERVWPATSAESSTERKEQNEPAVAKLEVEGGEPLTDAEAIELLGKILSAARSSVEGWGGRFLFVYLPDWRSVERAPEKNLDKKDEQIYIRV